MSEDAKRAKGPVDVAVAFKMCRVRRGMTTAAMAEIYGCSEERLSMIERGLGAIGFDELNAAFAFFGVMSVMSALVLSVRMTEAEITDVVARLPEHWRSTVAIPSIAEWQRRQREMVDDVRY